MVKISFQEVKDLYEASLDVYNVETSYIVSLIYLKALLAQFKPNCNEGFLVDYDERGCFQYRIKKANMYDNPNIILRWTIEKFR